ncbi:hypothetical protein GXW82_38710 [Streptacidiphilus sp. 4-A2]|nr:hypothetical protein [Streptacidiphilus sp. 4-A2]
MSELDALLQLLLPFMIVAAIVLLYRWAAARGHSVVSHRPQPGTPDEYGLLVPVAEPADDTETLRITALLDAAGVRSTVVATTRGVRIMVWGDQAEQARSLLRGSGQG